jgi:ribosomal protein L16 Arg81 hydroxylase
LKDDRDPPPTPTEEPVWDGILNDGDVIYLPRGWWHVAYPLDEPSLHLTVTVIPARGADLLRWLMDDMRRHAVVRMDLPRLADAATRKQYIARLRELLIGSMDDEVFTRFLGAWDAGMRARPRFDLPLAPDRQRAALATESRIRLATNRRLSFEVDAGGQTVHFHANDTRWECSPELVPALEMLSSDASTSFRDLCDTLPDQDAIAKLRRLLNGLAIDGAILQETSE